MVLTFIKEIRDLVEFAPLFVLEPKPIYTLSFSNLSNESLSKLLVRTAYSTVTAIPSDQVYIRNGCLIITNTEHLVINTSWLNITLSENFLIVAYTRFLSGGGQTYGRGGVGLYANATYDPVNNVYTAANYWLSVLGSFTTSGPLSYDFEGHIPWRGGQWAFSETINYFYYERNRTYKLWIARIDNYVFGGIIGGYKSWTVYINVTMYLPEIVSHSATLCFEKIEFYSLMEGGPSNRVSYLNRVLIDYDTWSELGYAYLVFDDTVYVYDVGALVNGKLYYFLREIIYR